MDKSVLLNFKTMRKCVHCKTYFALENELENTVIYKKKFFYHSSCLKTELMSKKKKRALSEQDADSLILNLRKETDEHAIELMVRNHLYLYLMQHYDVVMLPNYIYTKMEQIFDGTFIRMKCPIPPDHLLDMFQKKQTFLDKIYHKEKMNGVSRINYDLAVLIARYPSYLEWRGKREVENKQAQAYMAKPKIDMNRLGGQPKKTTEPNILDEEEDMV